MCKYREERDDGSWAPDICGKPAKWLSCSPYLNMPACDEHRCRCRVPINATVAELVAADGTGRAPAAPSVAQHVESLKQATDAMCRAAGVVDPAAPEAGEGGAVAVVVADMAGDEEDEGARAYVRVFGVPFEVEDEGQAHVDVRKIREAVVALVRAERARARQEALEEAAKECGAYAASFKRPYAETDPYERGLQSAARVLGAQVRALGSRAGGGG